MKLLAEWFMPWSKRHLHNDKMLSTSKGLSNQLYIDIQHTALKLCHCGLSQNSLQ